MARGKQLPHIGDDYLPAAEAPTAVALRLARDIHDTYALDPEPRAFWEMLKRAYPREFAKILLENALPVLAAEERSAAAPTPHERSPVTPIRPRIIDITG